MEEHQVKDDDDDDDDDIVNGDNHDDYDFVVCKNFLGKLWGNIKFRMMRMIWLLVMINMAMILLSTDTCSGSYGGTPGAWLAVMMILGLNLI